MSNVHGLGHSSITCYNLISSIFIVICKSLRGYLNNLSFDISPDFSASLFFPPAILQCELGELVCESLPGCVPLSKRCDLHPDCPPFLPDESSCHGSMVLLVFVVHFISQSKNFMYPNSEKNVRFPDIEKETCNSYILCFSEIACFNFILFWCCGIKYCDI